MTASGYFLPRIAGYRCHTPMLSAVSATTPVFSANDCMRVVAGALALWSILHLGFRLINRLATSRGVGYQLWRLPYALLVLFASRLATPGTTPAWLFLELFFAVWLFWKASPRKPSHPTGYVLHDSFMDPYA